MRPILPLLLAALACSPALVAADTPAPPDAGTPPPEAGAPPAPGGGDNRGGGDRMRRMIEQNPELKGVDMSTPEGREKFGQVMAKQMRERMAENQTAQRQELKKTLALSDDEFAAITPLLDRVETLRLHRNLVDRASSPMAMFGGRNGRNGGPGGPPGMTDPKNVLGDTPLDPLAAEIQAALKALKALVEDAQANTNETDLAMARVRKAREAWTAAMTKAQEELRSVLNRRQEAVLVDRGTIE